jgi:hypothetical protein
MGEIDLKKAIMRNDTGREIHVHDYRIPEKGIRAFVSPRGTNFEDCLRLAVMLDQDGPRDPWRNLLFDYRDTRFASIQLRDLLRLKILGLTKSPYAAGVHR